MHSHSIFRFARGGGVGPRRRVPDPANGRLLPSEWFLTNKVVRALAARLDGRGFARANSRDQFPIRIRGLPEQVLIRAVAARLDEEGTPSGRIKLQ